MIVGKMNLSSWQRSCNFFVLWNVPTMIESDYFEPEEEEKESKVLGGFRKNERDEC